MRGSGACSCARGMTCWTQSASIYALDSFPVFTRRTKGIGGPRSARRQAVRSSRDGGRQPQSTCPRPPERCAFGGRPPDVGPELVRHRRARRVLTSDRPTRADARLCSRERRACRPKTASARLERHFFAVTMTTGTATVNTPSSICPCHFSTTSFCNAILASSLDLPTTALSGVLWT